MYRHCVMSTTIKLTYPPSLKSIKMYEAEAHRGSVFQLPSQQRLLKVEI